uniref:putative barnase/colicin E5 family endoribonuclease n=1 Tax=Campylobacter lanienae TaxID=75658 RepID=UPI0030144517
VTDAIKHKGYGLSHILDKRMAEFMEQGLSKEQAEAKAIELINKLPDIIKNGQIVENAGVNTIILKEGNSEFRAGLSKGFFGKGDNQWVITSYEKKSPNAQNFDQVTNSKELGNGNNLSLKGKNNSTTKEIKSQDQTTQPMMNGFSTMAMEKAILHLGSGGMGGAMNANAEQDPNKKAEAFVKGFLLGAGGSVGAMKMLENSAKLAPQLAQVSQRLAKDLPMILNDRPDIVGKALGRTPKENYNYIFGGENAIGANKAKLKTAVEMAKNGADESEIWAKTGWYKDIDKKWKFEINPKGAELDISALKKATPNKLGDILKDDELFKAYPQVKDLSILPTKTKDGADAAYQEAEVFGLRRKVILFNDDYLQNATNDEIRSTLYHEIQHAIQSIEGFASGGSTQKLSYEEYKNLAGESEARNVEKRLNRTYSKDDAIDGEFNRLLIKDIDNPKWQELKQKRKEIVLAGKQDEADKIKKQLDQRQEFLKSQAVKNVERFSSYSPHPFKTLDINPNDRVVKYDSGMSASANPRQKAGQYAKWLSQADKMPPQAPDELYKAYDKAKRT